VGAAYVALIVALLVLMRANNQRRLTPSQIHAQQQLQAPRFGGEEEDFDAYGSFDGLVGSFEGFVGSFDGLVGSFEGFVGSFDGLAGSFEGLVGSFEGLVGSLGSAATVERDGGKYDGVPSTTAQRSANASAAWEEFFAESSDGPSDDGGEEP
jgi:hypothetical protein